MLRIFLSLAGIFGALAVVLGAFGAHALKDSLGERALEIFDTGTRYQMYHALALVLVALLLTHAGAESGFLGAAGVAFIVGTFLFSGSLYALALTGISALGMVTPVGGLAFIIGWLCLAVSAWKLSF